MNLETQVTSLEMSEKLKETGFEIETDLLWATGTEESTGGTISEIVVRDKYYYYMSDRESTVTTGCGCCAVSLEMDVTGVKYIPAYTFQQLWTVLLGAQERSRGEINMYWASQLRSAEVLPDTATKAILWCIENGYIEVSK